MTNIYESAVFNMTPGGSMHPGGLRLTDRAVRLAALSAGMRVADIGCGTGSTAAFLTEKYGLNVVGLEISDKLISLGLKRYPGLSLIRRDCQTLCLEYNSLDAIFLECTLSLLGDAQLILEQCARAADASSDTGRAYGSVGGGRIRKLYPRGSYGSAPHVRCRTVGTRRSRA